MSRVLIWSPNYAPELTGIPPLVTDAAEWLAARGHRVDVVTPLPNYPERKIQDAYRGCLWRSERREGVDVHRSWLRVRPQERLVDKALYELTASTMALPSVLRRFRDADVIVCLVPTLLAAMYTTLLPRRPWTVLWVQDRLSMGAAALDPGPRTRKVLRAVDRTEQMVVRRADRVVVCSPGFRDQFLECGTDPGRIEVLYNWADLARIERKAPPPGDHFRVLYSGNIGYSQGFETIIEAAKLVGPRVAVDIVGEGNAARAVSRLAQSTPNVRVRGPVTRAEYPRLLANHDAHLVLQRRVSAGANLPSKIASYLASGRPVIGSIDAESPAAELLRQSRGALLVEPESPPDLAAALIRLCENPDLVTELGGYARSFAEAMLDKDAALQRFERMILGNEQAGSS